MDTAQKRAIIVLLAGTLVGLIVLLASGGAPHETKRVEYRVAPDKVLPQARPLLSKDEPESPAAPAPSVAAAPSSAPGMPDAPAAPQAALPSRESQPAQGAALSETDEAIARSFAAPSPLVGVDYIAAYLASLKQSSEASRLYSTMGQLYARAEPPDLSGLAQSLESARAAAQTPEDLHYAEYVELDALRMAGESEEAGRRAGEVLGRDEPVTVSRLRTALLAAQLDVEAGRTEEAQTRFETVMRDSRDNRDALGSEGVELYRLAGLHLTRLLRERGEHARADALAETVGRQSGAREE